MRVNAGKRPGAGRKAAGQEVEPRLSEQSGKQCGSLGLGDAAVSHEELSLSFLFVLHFPAARLAITASEAANSS